MTEVLYRLDDRDVDPEYGTGASFIFNEPQPVCEPHALKVWHRTAKGAWVQRYPWSYEGAPHDKPVFVLNDAHKRYAYPTKQEALFSYMKRKERHVRILRHQLERAEARLRHAKKALEP